MCNNSYNSVNGVPTCLDSGAINGTLRGEFGFGGMVVSDCDAIRDAWAAGGHKYAGSAAQATALGMSAGTDQVCIHPEPAELFV